MDERVDKITQMREAFSDAIRKAVADGEKVDVVAAGMMGAALVAVMESQGVGAAQALLLANAVAMDAGVAEARRRMTN